MLDWFTAELWSTALHWLAYWGAGALLTAGALAAAWFSPLFKEAFLGVAIGAAALLAVEHGFVSFKPQQPEVCEHPHTDPNGPTVPMCFIKTDERGYGYWDACRK